MSKQNKSNMRIVSGQVRGRNCNGPFGFSNRTAVRAVVVTVSEPTPAPLTVAYEFGLTEQVVPAAGTVQETFTIEENPNIGVIATSNM